MTDENKKTDLDDCVPAMALNEMTSQFDAMFSTLGMAQNKATKFEAAARESAKLARDLQARLDRALQVEEELRLDLLRRESQLEKLEAGKPVSVGVVPTVSTQVGLVAVHTQVDIDRVVQLEALCENQKFTLAEVRRALDPKGKFGFKQLPEVASTAMDDTRLMRNELEFKTTLLTEIRAVHSAQGQQGGHLATLASELYSALHTARAEREECLKSSGELEQEIANLRKDVEVITNSRDRLQVVVDRETGQVDALNERITSLTQANSGLTVKVHYLTSALNIVQGERVHELEGQVSELPETYIIVGQAKLKSLTEEWGTIGLALFPLQSGIDGVFLGDTKQIIDKCHDLQNELSTMSTEFGRYKEAHWKLHKSYMELSSTAADLSNRRLKQGQELDTLRARVADLVGDLDAMSDLAKQAEAENATLRIQLSTAQSSEEKAIAGEAEAGTRAEKAEAKGRATDEELARIARGLFERCEDGDDIRRVTREIAKAVADRVRRERPACLVERLVAEKADFNVWERESYATWTVRVIHPGTNYTTTVTDVPAADVPKTLARLAGLDGGR